MSTKKKNGNGVRIAPAKPRKSRDKDSHEEAGADDQDAEDNHAEDNDVFEDQDPETVAAILGPTTRSGSRQPMIPRETARGSVTPRVRIVKARLLETTSVVSTSTATRTRTKQLSWPLASATIRPPLA
jgi:hypothetical protein